MPGKGEQMRHSGRGVVMVTLLVAAVGMGASGCTDGSVAGAADQSKVESATVERIDATTVRLRLTEEAVRKLDIQTGALGQTQVARSGMRKVIPYAAVIYDADGRTWAYTNPEPLTYVRQSITIETIDRDQAVLSEGPAVGTAVVTLGAAELHGVETGVGH